MWEFHSSCDVHGHFSLIVMCGEGLYLPVAGMSTLIVVVVLQSSFDVWWGGVAPFHFGGVLLLLPEGQLSSCSMYSTL